MEYGYFHPVRGYWQTTNEPPQHILDGYPEGTVEVPVKPSGLHEWNGSQWVELPPSTEALAAAARAQRNSLLTASDWTMIPDVPVDQVAWATYRQELRDITTQAGFPNEITWPIKPEENI